MAHKNDPIVVMGIDAALAHMGLVKVLVCPKTRTILELVDLKVLSTDKMVEKGMGVSKDRLRRGRELVRGISNFGYNGKHIARICCAEAPEGSQSAGAAFALGIATGILCGVTVPMVDVTPHEVKMASIGKRTASKEEMRQWAFSKFPNAPWIEHLGRRTNENEHVADALAAIEAGMLTEQFKAYAGIYVDWTSTDIDGVPKRRRLKR